MELEKDIMDLYSDFVRRRQAGQSGEEAWHGLTEDLKQIGQRELMRLMGLIRAWEMTNGRAYKPIHAGHAEAVVSVPGGIDEDQQPVIRRITPLETAVPAEGHSASATRHIGKGRNGLNIEDKSASTFAEGMVLCLTVEGNEEPIRIRPPQREVLIIGRHAPDSSIVPDIDLTPYDAADKGVSRLHAELSRRGDTLVISDMNSINCTYLNGSRLYPKEVRVLRDGDELCFGALTVRVKFGTGGHEHGQQG